GRGRAAAVRQAVGYQRRAQHADGGYALAVGSPTNAQSTAFAALALQAGGAKVDGVRRHGRSPLDYLRALQGADGSFAYARGSHQTPVWVTAQAVLALEYRPLPVVGQPLGTAEPEIQRSAPDPVGAMLQRFALALSTVLTTLSSLSH
ncbi:MAG: Prenyltransferase/squalene oxidase, partial [Solirubrobacteraceae bacterium]|nr:Prenyltransferase/squalene oxidase [Solirubrobacteraceae bacterium]